MTTEAMFESTEFLRFAEPVSEEAMQWWLSRMLMRGGTPEAVARRATASYAKPGSPLHATIRHPTESQRGMLEVWTDREPLRRPIRICERLIEIDPDYFSFDFLFDRIPGGETPARALRSAPPWCRRAAFARPPVRGRPPPAPPDR
jgi:hypothetical protein